MVRMIMHGCNGHMGKVIAGLAAEDRELTIVAGVDVTGDEGAGFPVYPSVAEVQEEADVVVDFSSARAIDRLIAGCLAKRLPLVLCTTGLDERQLAFLDEAAEQIPVLRSANMSLGINILMKLVQDAAKVLAGAGFDIEILERHHNRKLDAPSGTALALADSLNEAMDGTYHYVYDRSQRMEKRDPREIGISALRGGTIVGDHEVVFAGPDEVVSFHHHAYSRAIFGKGALEAAKFLAVQQAGKYDMSDVIAARS